MADEYGRTELHYAANQGDPVAVAAQLEAGDSPNLADQAGWTPLHFAAQANSPEVVRLLLDAGSRVDVVDQNGNTPLSTAVFNSRGEGEVIGLLRDAGADPFRENDHGVSPVELARTIGNYDVAQYFADLPA